MTWFHHLTVGKKLGLGFTLVLILTIALGVFAIWRIAKVNNSTIDLVTNWLASVDILGEMRYDLADMRRSKLRYLISSDKQDAADMKGKISEVMARIAQDQQTYEPTISSPEERQLYKEFQALFSRYSAVEERVGELYEKGETKRAYEMSASQGTASFNAAEAKLAEDIKFNEKEANNAAKTAADIYSSSRIWIIGLLIATFASSIMISISTARSLSGAVSGISGMIEAVAANNLAIPDMQITSHDEIGNAGIALNQMKNNLREMIRSIASTAEHVAAASEELSCSATQQARSSDTQKDQITRVATAMQEMSFAVLQVSENSNKAAESSRQAAETAHRGGTIVEDTLAKMRAIAESVGATARKMEGLGKSSDQIGRIISVIDDIADQTNLLALNAAIEAARAGEQGRGFAVVADEVRKLAERTTIATKEIAKMIKNIQDETKTAVAAMELGTKQVEDGVTSTAQAGDTLKEIIQTSEQVGEMIMHIATAATEQSSASEEINNNMEQISKLVKESAVGAQQSAKACQDLSGLALDLQKMVGNFQLDSSSSFGHSHRKPYRAAVESFAPQDEAPDKAFAASTR